MNPYSALIRGSAFVSPSTDWRANPAYGRPEVSYADMVSRNAFLSVRAIDKLVQGIRNRLPHA